MVADVGFDQRPPAYEALVPGGKVVVHKGRIASFGESLASVRPDIAGPPVTRTFLEVTTLLRSQPHRLGDALSRQKLLEIGNSFGQTLL